MLAHLFVYDDEKEWSLGKAYSHVRSLKTDRLPGNQAGSDVLQFGCELPLNHTGIDMFKGRPLPIGCNMYMVLYWRTWLHTY